LNEYNAMYILPIPYAAGLTPAAFMRALTLYPLKYVYDNLKKVNNSLPNLMRVLGETIDNTEDSLAKYSVAGVPLDILTLFMEFKRTTGVIWVRNEMEGIQLLFETDPMVKIYDETYLYPTKPWLDREDRFVRLPVDLVIESAIITDGHRLIRKSYFGTAELDESLAFYDPSQAPRNAAKYKELLNNFKQIDELHKSDSQKLTEAAEKIKALEEASAELEKKVAELEKAPPRGGKK